MPLVAHLWQVPLALDLAAAANHANPRYAAVIVEDAALDLGALTPLDLSYATELFLPTLQHVRVRKPEVCPPHSMVSLPPLLWDDLPMIPNGSGRRAACRTVAAASEPERATDMHFVAGMLQHCALLRIGSTSNPASRFSFS